MCMSTWCMHAHMLQVIAPTRHGAHNWEQGGRLSAARALDSIASLANDGVLPAGAAVDTRRVLYAGHSMGGHGAWMGALQGAARALGVASVCGWTRKETYGDVR